MSAQITGIMVQVDGKWLTPAETNNVLTMEQLDTDVPAYRGIFRNQTEKSIRLGGFRFNLSAMENIPGKRIRLYKEGWTMTSAAASVRYGECDFEADPGYLRYAVSTPEEYTSNTPNKFSAEYVVVLNDTETNRSILAGFISSANQFGRFSIELSESGIKELYAISSTDCIVMNPGDTIQSEELVFLEGDDGYSLLEQYADLWGKRMNALSWPHIPTGWCSWYYYFDKVTQADVIENASYLQAHKDEFPVEYIQIDDGYQSALGDWLIPNQKFPDGLNYLAESIKERGFKPGIWLAPFMVEERSVLYHEHPDWMVRNENGEVVWVTNWRGCRVASLDGTHPKAQEYLEHVFSSLCKLGFDYVKIDFLVYGCCGKGGYYHDPSATRAQALRRGVEAIRRGMGDKFILGCTTPLGPVVGLVNGERIGTDITPYWEPDRKIYSEAPTVYNVCRNIINRSYMNGRLWLSDPDVHIARDDNNKLTMDEVTLWTNALKLVGGMLLFSDRFESLSPERAELSKDLLGSHGQKSSRPIDMFECDFPEIWQSEIGDLTLIGVFNFSETSKDFSKSLKEKYPKQFTQSDNIIVQPHSCQVFVQK